MDDVTTPISAELALVDPDLAAAARALLPPPSDCLARTPARTVSARDAYQSNDADEHQPVLSRTSLATRRERPRGRASNAGRAVSLAAAWVILAAVLASPLLAFMPTSESARPTLLPPAPSVSASDELSRDKSTAGRSEPVVPPTTGPGGAEASSGVGLDGQRRRITPSDGASESKSGSAVATEDLADTDPPVSRKQSEPSVPLPEHEPTVEKPAVARTRTVVLRWPPVPDVDLYNVILVRGDERVDRWPTTNRMEVGSAPGESESGVYRWFVYPGRFHAGQLRYGALVAHGVVRVAPGSIKSGSPPKPKPG